MLVVKVTVATPLPAVVLVGEEKLPPLVLLQVTTFPAVVTGVPPASASWAVIVTAVPASGVDPLDVTRYWEGGGAAMVWAVAVSLD